MACRRAEGFFSITFKINLCFFLSGKTDSVLINDSTIAIGMIHPYRRDMEKGMDVLIPGELSRCMCFLLPI